jgi:hypothetical protein
LIDQSVGIEEYEPAMAVRPIQNILTDAVFEELGFANSGAAAYIEVPLAGGGGKGGRFAAADQSAELEGVAWHFNN